MSHHPHLHPLAQAAADNDSMAEEVGVEDAIGRIGLNVEDVRNVAEQRALRVILLRRGQALPRKLEGVPISANERVEMLFLTALYMDGISIGWRGRELSSPTD